MKKLNITKDKFTESKYFTTKYGKLKYVSESGNVYKTDKGNMLKFKESKNLVNEGAGAGYEITVEDIEIDKVLSVKMGDEKGSWAEFEATIKPCNVVVSAEGYYDVFCKD